MTVWAFNIHNSEDVIQFIAKSLNNGIARFGWSNNDNDNLKINITNLSKEEKERRKKNKFLLEIKEGDWIVQKNVPYWGAVTAGEVEEEYNFDTKDNKIGDFRHFFKLKKETIIEFERDDTNVLPIVREKLKLQSRYNKVNAVDEFLESIDKLKRVDVLSKLRLNREIQKIEDLYHEVIKLLKQDNIELSLMYCRQIVEGILLIIQVKEKIESQKQFPANLRLIESYMSGKYEIFGMNPFFDNLKHFTKLGNKVVHYNPSNSRTQFPNSTVIEHRLNSMNTWFYSFLINYHQPKKSEDLFFNKQEKEALPICIKNIEIENYFSLKNINISNIPVDCQFVVFTGNNGEGKTAILQSIALAMYGGNEYFNKDASKIFGADNETDVFIEVKYLEKNNFIEYKSVNTLYSEIIKIEEVVAYGASRLQLQSSESQYQAKLRKSNIHGIFKTDNILQNIEHWLKEESYKENIKRVEAVIKLLIKLMPSISNIEIQDKSNEHFILFTENDINLHSEQLSAGNKSILAMIGDMIIRLYETQPDTTEPTKLQGIVLIDEIETHLHPKWQREFPKILSENFQKIQFIISTHSPIVLLGMSKNTVFYNISKNEDKQTTIQKLNIDIENVLPNQILTSALFDMDNIRNVYNKGIEHLSVETEHEIKERKEKEELIKKLSTGFKFKISKK